MMSRLAERLLVVVWTLLTCGVLGLVIYMVYVIVSWGK